MIDKKLKAVRFGRWGEELAVWVLRLQGYRILTRNLRTRTAEIDIIAQKGRTLCFIEVKSRPREELALQAFSTFQQKRLIVAAEAFLSANQRYAGHVIRFDFMAISPCKWPRHIKNAWYDER